MCYWSLVGLMVDATRPGGTSKNASHSQLPTQTPAKTKSIDFHCHPDLHAKIHLGQQHTYVGVSMEKKHLFLYALPL